ncbi:MAG TPA: protein kinase [Kofleriaceae bacterium]|jgi:serine/threonine protein kinase/tetratricopeptide (TPR) repeat protein|nr:protein kinase [Kofleriaceae bacterium]
MPFDPQPEVSKTAIVEAGQGAMPAARAHELEVAATGTPTSIERVAPQAPHAPPHDPHLPQVGSTIKHYELLRKLGEGGMGAVYLARDTMLGRLVAIKVLRMHSGPSAERFLIEAQATARCRHDNIVLIHEVDQLDGYLYMVLEYLEGSTLREWMAQRERLAGAERPAEMAPSSGFVSPNLAVELMIPVVRALACAHQLGIVHRDLKPENIFLTKAGRVVVLDFGIAKRLDANELSAITAAWRPLERGARLTQDGALLGTVPYMSPEQLRCEDIDARSDLWTMGILLYELATGVHPLSNYSTVELLEIGDSGEPIPSVRDQRPDIGALGAVIDRCLQKPKDRRYRSAEELLAALEALARDRAPHVAAAWVSSPLRAREAPTILEDPPLTRRPVAALPPGTVRRGLRGKLPLLTAALVAAAGIVVLAARGGERSEPTPTAPRVVLPAVDTSALSAEERWLGPVVQRLLSDELIEAWGLEVELGSPLPDLHTVIATSQLSRAPSGRLRLALDGTTLEAATALELATAAAARLVDDHVPVAARHPTADDLAAVGAHDPEAWRLWRRAEHETMLTRFARAGELCRQALARDPEFPVASLELALTYSNNDAAGVRELAHAAELMDRVPVRPLWRTALTGAQRLKDGNFLGAALTAQELLAMDLTPRERLWIQLRWLTARLYLGALPASIAPELVLLTERYPDHPAAYKLLTNLYLDTDQPTAPELALRYASRAAQLAPEDAEVRANLAVALLRAGRRDEARARLDEIDRLDPDDKRLAGMVIFGLHMALGELAEAELDTQRELAAGMRILGTWHTAWLDLYWGRFEAGLRGLLAAAEQYDAMGASAWAGSARYIAGRQALLLGDHAAALAAFERVAAGHTRKAPRAGIQALIVAGKLDDARARTAALPDDSAERRDAELAIASAAHDVTGVLAVFGRIEPLSTTPTHLAATAAALDRSGQPDQAATMYQRLVDHVNAWQEPIATTRAWSRLGHLRERAGDIAGARTAYAEVLKRWGKATTRTPEVDDARRQLRALRGP